MQDSGLVLYNGPRSVDYESYCQTWYDYVGLYGEPLSSTQDGSYDDSYYLTYEEVDDYSSRSWYKNGGNNQDYRGKQNPYSGCGTCLGDYTSYFGCHWGENDQFYSEEGYGAYGSSLEKEKGSLKYGSYNDKMQPDYSENEWPGYGGLDFGCRSIKEDFECSSSWDNWEHTTLYERIFGH